MARSRFDDSPNAGSIVKNAPNRPACWRKRIRVVAATDGDGTPTVWWRVASPYEQLRCSPWSSPSRRQAGSRTHRSRTCPEHHRTSGRCGKERRAFDAGRRNCSSASARSAQAAASMVGGSGNTTAVHTPVCRLDSSPLHLFEDLQVAGWVQIIDEILRRDAANGLGHSVPVAVIGDELRRGTILRPPVGSRSRSCARSGPWQSWSCFASAGTTDDRVRTESMAASRPGEGWAAEPESVRRWGAPSAVRELVELGVVQPKRSAPRNACEGRRARQPVACRVE